MPKCPKCTKEVYFAERVTSLGKDWHRPCLKCEKCSKTLSAGSHAEVLDVEELKATHSQSRATQVHPPHQEEGNSAFYNVLHTILNQNKQPKKFLFGTTILCYFLSVLSRGFGLNTSQRCSLVPLVDRRVIQ